MLTGRQKPTGAREQLRPYRRELQAVARRLRHRLRPLDAPDLRAAGALRRDRQPHPWTAEAEAIWTSAPDNPSRAHHLAVLLHARAYDLEASGSPDASGYWRQALWWWAQVHRDDAFWDRFQRGLPERMGVKVDPAIVTQARRRLPGDLLQVHADLVRTYQDREPGRARNHLHILKSAPFDPTLTDGDPVDAHWTALLQPTITAARADLEAQRWEDAIDRLRSWVDPDDLRLNRWLLHAYRRWNGALRLDDPSERRQIVANLREAERVVDRLDERTIDKAPRELCEELARHHVWRGWIAAIESQEQLRRLAEPGSEAAAVREIRAAACRSAALAVSRFDLARKLDPQLTTDADYGTLEEEQAVMRRTHAHCRLEAMADGEVKERDRRRELRAVVELLAEVGRFDCRLLQDASMLVTRAGDLADRYGVKVDKQLRALRQTIRDCRQDRAREA